MTRKGKTGAIVFIIILIIAIIYGILRIYKAGPKEPDAALNFIPVDAPVIVKSHNFELLLNSLEKDKFWNEIINISGFGNFKETYGLIDSLCNSNKILGNIFKREVYISLHRIGKESLKPVFFFSTNRYGQHNIINLISGLVDKKGIITSRKYETFTIYDIKLNKNNKKFSLTINKGIIIISPSSILVENSIRQYNSGYNVKQEKGFMNVKSTSAENSEANIFLNYKLLPKTTALAFNNLKSNQIKNLDQLADWAEIDLTLKKDVLLLNGFIYTNDSVNNLLNILVGQAPKKFTLHNVFPATSNSFFTLLLSDPVLFKNKYYDYLRKNGKLKLYQNKATNFKNNYKVNIENFIYDNIDDELGIVNCTINSEDNNRESFFVINTKGYNTTKEKLVEIIENRAKKENRPFNDFKTDYKIDEGAKYTIYSFPEAQIIKDLFGVFFNFENAGYVTMIDKYLVFGSNVNSLGRLIYTNVLNKTIEKSLEYNDFSEFVNSRSNLYYYIKLPRSKDLIQKNFSNALNKLFTENYGSFEKMNTLAFQIGGQDEMLYNNITVSFYNETFDNPITEWETLLDTAINFKPVLVTNHYTNEYEIFVQDLKNNIYLINNSGRVTWKLKLDEPVLSDVIQVDYFNNGKLQLLFNTKSAMHLIDRNGNYVERYPVRLRADATTGMSIFDYDKNRNYRIFIPCTDKKVYAYSLAGSLVTGWDFDKTDSEIKSPVQHFNIDGKDYIVFADDNKIYFLNRRGEPRLNTQNNISKGINSAINFENNRFVTTDNLGNICFIDLDGKVEKITTGNISPEHFFDFNDVDADGKKDIIICNDKTLFVYDQNKNLIYSYTFKDVIYDKPVYYHFSLNDRKIGILLKDKQEIFLINNNGKLYKGFPLTGNSLFTIGMLKNNNGKFNLIVSGRNNYLYNYAVN